MNYTQNVFMLIRKERKKYLSLFSDVICLKYLDHKYRPQLYLNLRISECFVTLPFNSREDNIVLPRWLS